MCDLVKCQHLITIGRDMCDQRIFSRLVTCDNSDLRFTRTVGSQVNQCLCQLQHLLYRRLLWGCPAPPNNPPRMCVRRMDLLAFDNGFKNLTQILRINILHVNDTSSSSTFTAISKNIQLMLETTSFTPIFASIQKIANSRFMRVLEIFERQYVYLNHALWPMN